MDPMLAQIILFAGNFAPRGWAFCDGQLLPIASNQALFSLLGTTYGGDGRSTFALPDLRGRAPIGPRNGPGLSNYRLGQRAGLETVTLNTTEIPSHTHTNALRVSSENATQAQATQGTSIGTPGAPSGRSFNSTYGFNQTTPDTNLNTNSVIIGNTGGSQAHENRQPLLALNYIIAMQGIFPSRN
ncbi:Microcystin-dependent protein [Tenacibaculum sp. MAR_2009_124]|uniref:phage tail protein n=1 Tax=Tenacibaculum sp. MAR_2009_124 TaxID=1250059 RepID=UPI000898A727|nr:tail fiber protein [Tenacibaculum sp. MAR_2009_124]SEC85234.1 Microcystin-dependent protein [Tenacibaculum sp. MAR_2009_124]